jgi:hypothetical protein
MQAKDNATTRATTEQGHPNHPTNHRPHRTSVRTGILMSPVGNGGPTHAARDSTPGTDNGGRRERGRRHHDHRDPGNVSGGGTTEPHHHLTILGHHNGDGTGIGRSDQGRQGTGGPAHRTSESGQGAQYRAHPRPITNPGTNPSPRLRHPRQQGTGGTANRPRGSGQRAQHRPHRHLIIDPGTNTTPPPRCPCRHQREPTPRAPPPPWLFTHVTWRHSQVTSEQE